MIKTREETEYIMTELIRLGFIKSYILSDTPKAQEGTIPRYWEPFFKGRIMGEITAADIDVFINHMGEMNISGSRKNVVILAGIKPLRQAFT